MQGPHPTDTGTPAPQCPCTHPACLVRGFPLRNPCPSPAQPWTAGRFTLPARSLPPCSLASRLMSMTRLPGEALQMRERVRGGLGVRWVASRLPTPLPKHRYGTCHNIYLCDVNLRAGGRVGAAVSVALTRAEAEEAGTAGCEVRAQSYDTESTAGTVIVMYTEHSTSAAAGQGLPAYFDCLATTSRPRACPKALKYCDTRSLGSARSRFPCYGAIISMPPPRPFPPCCARHRSLPVTMRSLQSPLTPKIPSPSAPTPSSLPPPPTLVTPPPSSSPSVAV